MADDDGCDLGGNPRVTPSHSISSDECFSDVTVGNSRDCSTRDNDDLECDEAVDMKLSGRLLSLNMDAVGHAKQHKADVDLTVNQDDLADPLKSPVYDDNTTVSFQRQGHAGTNTDVSKDVTSPQSSDVTPQSDNESSFFEDREFDFLKTERVRRSTSLKTTKTPPGTPSRKKAVRFADALGLDLESVRHILNLDAPPKIPNSALQDLEVGLVEQHKGEGSKFLSACFPQPGATVEFMSKVMTKNVLLENCMVDDRTMTVTGTVRVNNVSYHKSTIVRYSVNHWVTSDDVRGSYVANSNDGPTDRFSFTINVPYNFNVGSRLEFAVLFTAGGKDYWDNNDGTNYIIECFAQSVPVSQTDNTWMHFL